MDGQLLLQMVFMVGSAVTLAFGLARAIVKQQAQQMEASQQLMRDIFLQIDKRLQRLEDAINNLTQVVADIRLRQRVLK